MPVRTFLFSQNSFEQTIGSLKVLAKIEFFEQNQNNCSQRRCDEHPEQTKRTAEN